MIEIGKVALDMGAVTAKYIGTTKKAFDVAKATNDVIKGGMELKKTFNDLPFFLNNINAESISDFNEADKPLYSTEKENLSNNINNIEKQKEDVGNEVNEEQEKIGGSYKDVFKEGMGETYEVHHMPADSINGLERNDGPAIRMDKEDHRETASCGNSLEAREYRAQQQELIEKGKFKEALQMDIDDIHDKFGNKYDEAISQMLEYVDKLEEEERI